MFTWFRQPSNRALEVRIDALERALAKTIDAVTDLEGQHRRLRGRFYAERGVSEADAPAKETKAQVLARIGYIPGRPAPHNKG